MGVQVTLTFPNPVGPLAEAAVRSAINDVAHVALEDANRTVPFEDGPLEASGHVTGQGSNASSVSRSVVYATPYAQVQHEDTSLNHQGKGRAQWLELTVYEEKQRYTDFIAQQVRARMGG